jgi:DedD protein
VSDENTSINVRMTRKGIVVWCALLFFVMGWMFVLGIMVGRGTAPIPLKAQTLETELNELKTAMLNKAQAEAEAGSANQKDPQASELGFYEALKKAPAKESYAISPAPPKKKPEPAAVPSARTPPASVAPAPAAAPPKPAAENDRRAAAPNPPPKPVTAAAPAPSTRPSGRYTIQIAASKDAQGAEKIVQALRAKGYPGYSIYSEVAGKGSWFRVRVGGFEDRAAAEAMLRRLNDDRFQGIVVATQ